MLKNKLMILLASIAISLFAFTACDEDSGVDPDPDTQPKPSAPTNLQATSINATTVHLKYAISPSESNGLWQDYQISWKENVGPTAPQAKVVLKGTNTIEVTGLIEGKVYLFTLVARYTNDSVSAPVTILWSPASRFEKNSNDETIKVYETASAFGSGLQLFDLGQESPRVRTVANGSEWDLGLRTVDGKITFSSAAKTGYEFSSGQTPKATYIYNTKFSANSLDEVFDSRAMNDGARNSEYNEQSFDITNETSSLVFYVRKPVSSGSISYNYAKVLVKRINGTFLQGSGSNRHIIVEISYQKTPNVPYAKTSNDNATN